MTGNDLREWYGTPLRTRERAALDVARAALRKIYQNADAVDNDSCAPAVAGALMEMATEALERMAVILGERNHM